MYLTAKPPPANICAAVTTREQIAKDAQPQDGTDCGLTTCFHLQRLSSAAKDRAYSFVKRNILPNTHV